MLFVAHLIHDRGLQSSTVKSYVSAIKRMLLNDNYEWQDNQILIRSLTRACRIINDTVRTRLPIHCGLLEQIIFEIRKIFADQWYLQSLYKAIFMLGYYGLMRVGEMAMSPHSLRASDVHLSTNKRKLLLILHTSEMHDESSLPQKIKIVANSREKSGYYR